MPPRNTRAEILENIIREQREAVRTRQERLRREQEASRNPFTVSETGTFGLQEFNEFLGYSPVNSNIDSTITRNRSVNNKKYMKREHHYSREERDDMHNPATDWCETKRGEKCINACSLVIDDILSKVKETSVGGTVQ